MSIPHNIHHLNRILLFRIVVAAAFLGVFAGGGAYWLESRRIEATAAAAVAVAVRHFQVSAMQMLGGGMMGNEHGEIEELLRKDNLVGLRVYGEGERPRYEAWGDISESTRSRLSALPRTKDVSTSDYWHEQITIGADYLIRLQHRLSDPAGRQVGQLEGFYRADAATLDQWREQISRTVGMVVVAVLGAAIALYPVLLRLLRHATGLASRLLVSNLSLLVSLGSAIAKRDSDTDAHNYRVTLYAVALAESLRLPHDEIAELITGAFLHDVGKIGIPDAILLKPGRLTADEFEIMKTHVLHGLDIVAGNEWMAKAGDVIRHHHEKLDGTGYPDGLAGDRIPRIARLFAVVDVFDALVSARPYKAPMPPEMALSILRRDSGKHFDPVMVDAFGSIAGGLYAALDAANDADLRRRLHAAIADYF
ncbi:MAG: HD-GYP domain-containing protein [Sulfuritalea sp.]|nr:HD-GYP domain-containing protein [Sulfuritalea sp.]